MFLLVGGAWARFGPRLKTDKDIGGAGSAGEVQGDGVVVRWGVSRQQQIRSWQR